MRHVEPHPVTNRTTFPRTPAGWMALAVVLALALPVGVRAQANRIDLVSPMAPALAAHGPHAVGVRTLQVVAPQRPDVLQIVEGGPTTLTDRQLVLEVWYPARLGDGQTPGGTYVTPTRDPSLIVTVAGRAVRDAGALSREGGYPLVVVSHGYPGNRYLLAHLAENLASKGFVVIAIDHTDSTYTDQRAFASTLYHRPFDLLFVVDEAARLGGVDAEGPLAGLVDASRVGLVGYSMGGYGVLNVVGAGFSQTSITMPGAPPNGLLRDRSVVGDEWPFAPDPRIRAAIAIAPWGMTRGAWDDGGLAGVTTPTLLVAGSADQISGYETGVRAVFERLVNAERHLLTFVNAGHNAGAPMPPPLETYSHAGGAGTPPFLHYADAIWDTVRMNNILAHFATAFLGVYLEGDATRAPYLDVVPRGADAVFALDPDGQPQPGHTHWQGFARGTAAGLIYERLGPAPHAQ